MANKYIKVLLDNLILNQIFTFMYNSLRNDFSRLSADRKSNSETSVD